MDGFNYSIDETISKGSRHELGKTTWVVILKVYETRSSTIVIQIICIYVHRYGYHWCMWVRNTGKVVSGLVGAVLVSHRVLAFVSTAQVGKNLLVL